MARTDLLTSFSVLVLFCLSAAFVPRVATSWRGYYEHACATIYNCTIVDFAVESLTLQTLIATLESSSFERQHTQLRNLHTNYLP